MLSGARTDLEPRANLPEVTKAEVDNVSVSRAAATADLPHDEKLAQLHQGTKTNKSRSKAVNLDAKTIQEMRSSGS